MDKQRIISKNLLESIALKEAVLADEALIATICSIAQAIVTCYQKGGKVLFCGNGGSAADAQHLAAELSGRYYKNRPPLFAEALHVNSSYLTAVANDYGYEHVFERLVEGMGNKGDVLMGISTSGGSINVIKALQKAKEKGMLCVGMTGNNPQEMGKIADHCIAIPSDDTPRIQELYMIIGHSICEMVEKACFPE